VVAADGVRNHDDDEDASSNAGDANQPPARMLEALRLRPARPPPPVTSSCDRAEAACGSAASTRLVTLKLVNRAA